MLDDSLCYSLVDDRAQIAQIGGDGRLPVAQLHQAVCLEVPQQAHRDAVEVQWLSCEYPQFAQRGFQASLPADVAALLQVLNVAICEGKEVYISLVRDYLLDLAGCRVGVLDLEPEDFGLSLDQFLRDELVDEIGVRMPFPHTTLALIPLRGKHLYTEGNELRAITV